MHQLPARVRLRVPGKRGDAEYFAHVAERLGACPGVQTVRANAVTCSVLVERSAKLEDIARFAEQQGLFRLPTLYPEVVPVRHRAAEGLRELDRDLQTITGGEFDLNSVLLTGLLGLGFYQILNGVVVPPAVTLLWYAIATAELSGRDTAGALPAA